MAYGKIDLFIVCLLLVAPTQCNLPMPCCQIKHLEPGDIAPFASVAGVYLPALATCSNVNVAVVKFLPEAENGRVSKQLCVNGFSIITFLEAVLHEIGEQRSKDEDRLLFKLRTTKNSFISELSVKNTETSGFNDFGTFFSSV